MFLPILGAAVSWTTVTTAMEDELTAVAAVLLTLAVAYVAVKAVPVGLGWLLSIFRKH